MPSCDIQGCEKPAVRIEGECVLCNRRMCCLHLTSNLHKCPEWANHQEYDPAAWKSKDQEIDKLMQKINIQALVERASSLRDGVQCTALSQDEIYKTHPDVMGGNNYHITLRFSDDVEWIARIRRENATSPTPQGRDAIFLSEVATLKFLEGTRTPTPIVHDFAVEGSENPVGVGYMLQDKMPGWATILDGPQGEEKLTLLRDVADVFIELSLHPLQTIGSPVLRSESSIGALARESAMDFDIRTSQFKTLGPFESVREYYSSQVELILDLIRRQEMYAKQPIDAYLVHLFLLQIIPQITKDIDTMTNGKKPLCFLRHADDKGDHLLVDDNFHVTAVIDWESAYTVPAPLAFRSPMMTFKTHEFFTGVNSLSEDEEALAETLEEKGRPDLAKYVREGKIHHRFAFCCGADFLRWEEDFLGLFKGLRSLVGVDADLDWDEWKEVALDRYAEDEGLQQVMQMVKEGLEGSK